MSKKKNDDNGLLEKLLELNIKYAIEDSNINMRMIDNRIKFYQTLISPLEDTKPFFFQKKKLIEYNNKKEEYENKISQLYSQLGEEYELIEKIGTNDYSSVKSMLNDLDIEIIDGKISREDIIRLIEPMVYNYYRLQEKLESTNDLKTYLSEKISKVSLFKSDISEFELYPTMEIQIRNLDYDYLPGNVRLSERQEKVLKEEQRKNLKKCAKMMADLFD
jgi:hypothetical protein